MGPSEAKRNSKRSQNRSKWHPHIRKSVDALSECFGLSLGAGFPSPYLSPLQPLLREASWPGSKIVCLYPKGTRLSPRIVSLSRRVACLFGSTRAKPRGQPPPDRSKIANRSMRLAALSRRMQKCEPSGTGICHSQRVPIRVDGNNLQA